MSERSMLHKMARAAGWVVGTIAWLLFVASIGMAMSDVLKQPLGVVGAHLLSFAAQAAMNGAFAYWLSRRLAIPQTVWVSLALGALLGVVTSAWIATFVLMLQWLTPELTATSARELGYPVNVATLIPAMLANYGSLISGAVIAFFLTRKSTPVAEGPHLRLAAAWVIAVAVALAIGGSWFAAKSAIDFVGPASSSVTLEAGQTAALYGGLGNVVVPSGWAGDVITYADPLPRWTGLAVEPPARQFVRLEPPVKQGQRSEVFAMMLIEQSRDSWRKRLSRWSNDASLTVMDLPDSTFRGLTRKAFSRTDPVDATGAGNMTVYVFINHPVSPALITLNIRYRDQPPSADMIGQYLDAFELKPLHS